MYVLADVSHVLPPFPSPDLGSLPEPISMNDVKKLQSNYRIHCEVLHTVVEYFFKSRQKECDDAIMQSSQCKEELRSFHGKEATP